MAFKVFADSPILLICRNLQDVTQNEDKTYRSGLDSVMKTRRQILNYSERSFRKKQEKQNVHPVNSLS